MARVWTYLKPPAVALAWACALGICFAWLERYASVAGSVGSVPVVWPGMGVATAPAAGGYRLLIFLHPHCPCSRASVRVLERIVAACDGRLDVEAVLVRPAGADERWEQTDLARSVAAIPGVRTTVDAGGSVARRFGARTSGQIVLYDPAGHLVFGGGITPSRGHEGDSAGGDAIVAAVRSTSAARAGAAVAPVYGCALDGPAARMPSAPFTEHAK